MNRVAFGSYVTDTATGAVANFEDGADNIPMKDVLVHIEPVQEGSGDPSPDNVRPITGWTGAKVTRTGKNLYPILIGADMFTTNGGASYSNDNGKLIINTVSSNQASGIYLMPRAELRRIIEIFNAPLTVSMDIEASASGSVRTVFCGVQDLRTITNSKQRVSITAMEKSQMNFNIYGVNNGATLTVSNLQLELGSTATDYEPYSGQTYSITFPTEAGTVYGGTLDVTSGVLTVDRAMVDLGTLQWGLTSAGSFGAAVTGMKTEGELLNNAICDYYPIVSNGYNGAHASEDKVLWRYTATDGIRVRDSEYSTNEQIGVGLSGRYLCYTLATPITYQLTPQEITSLLGTNNLWADTGNIDVTYCVNPTLLLDNESSEIQSIKSMIAGVESSAIATKNYSIGDLVIVGDTLYEVTVAIALGETISASNAVVTTVDNTIKNRIADSVDDTLTVSGKAADAKVTGDEIDSLKEDFSLLNDITESLEINNFYNIKKLLEWRIGRYAANGYKPSYTAYINNTGTLPAGTYNFKSIPTGYSFALFQYVSESEGVQENAMRTNDIIEKTISTQFKISIYKQSNTAMTSSDIQTIKSQFVVERLDIAVPDVNFSVTPGISQQIKELYAPYGENLRFRQFYMTNGIGRIAIQDANDWVSHRDFTEDAPAQIGVPYEIPPYRGSGITTWIVLKSNNFSYSGSGNNYFLSDAVKNIKNTPIIAGHLVSKFENAYNVSDFSTQKIVFLGDSIFGYERGDTSIPVLVGNYTGATTYNCAFGGTMGGGEHATNYKYFDFTELSDAIVANDYSSQVAHESDAGVPSYFADIIDTLENIDFSTIDLICLTYGGNDYNMDAVNVSDFVTNMCVNINKILSKYPNIRFMLMNPPYKRFLDNTTHEFINDGDTKQNTFGKTLKDYAESYKTISESIHAPYIDAYNDLGINRYNAEQWFIENNGSHPSEQGRKETAKLVAQHLKTMLYS